MEVLFDVDGVLIEPFLFRRHLKDVYGVEPQAARPFFDTRFRSCAIGRSDLLNELPHLFSLIDWQGDPSEFLELWFSTENAPIESSLRFVAALRRDGTRCHIASNQERHRAKYLADDMGFSTHFDRLFFSCELGVAKPDPEYFARIERTLGRAGSALVLIDDHAPNVAAARSRGWHAVLYEGEASLEEVGRILAGAGP